MPSLPPPRTTELWYDGAWHPVSVRESDAVTITRGLTSKGTRAEPNAATMRLGNRDGEVSAHDPAAPLYGKIGRNTPIRFSVAGGRPHLLLPGDNASALTCPDSPALAVTDLDVRIEVALDSYTAVQELAARGTADSQRSWSVRIGPGWVQLSWYPTGAFASQKTATVHEDLPVAPGQRLALRVVLDTDDGAGGHLLSVYWARSLRAGRWELLGTASAGAGTTVLHDGTAGLHVGTSPGLADAGAKGRVYAFELWDGATGARKVALDFSTAEAGASSFTADGVVWTKTGAAVLSNSHVRLEGEVPAWPPERHVSGADSTVAITPAGIMRRLGIGKKPLASALRRAITTRGPIECWPLTDGAEATEGTALIGTSPMRSSGGLSKFVWGKGTLEDWIEPVLQVAAGTGSDMTATLPPSSAAATGWAVDWVRSGTGGLEVVRLLDRNGGATQIQWTVVADSSANVLRVYADQLELGTSTATTTINDANIFDGRAHHIRLHASQTMVGAPGTSWVLYVDGVPRATSFWSEKTIALQQFQYTALLGSPGSAPVSIGYVTYWPQVAPQAHDLYQAMAGHAGESAAARIARVAAEQGVPVGIDGDPALTEPLGIQKRETFLSVLEAASDADLGYLLERRDARALLYRARHTLYTQTPAVVLDYSQGVISGELRPVDDDRLSRNDVTVKRDGGSEHTAVLETGRMSVQDPPAGVGRYDEAVTLSLAADAQTIGQAWWRMHLGTHEGLRYPRITVDLANPRAAPLIADLLALDVGDLLRLQKLPPEYGPGDIDLIVRGYTEEISDKKWTITFVCDPGRPWTVGILGDPVLGRLDTDGTTLGAPVTATDTSLVLVSNPGPPWITSGSHPGEFPFGLELGGETVQVTGIRGLVEDAFTRSETSGWGTSDSGQPWTRSGGTAAEYLVTGGVGVHATAVRGGLRATTVPVPVADIDLRADCSMAVVPAGGTAEIHLMARRAGASDYYSARLMVAAGGALTLSLRRVIGGTDTQLGTYATGLVLGAGAWYTVRLSAQGTALAAKVWPRGTQEPADWQVTATDSSLTLPGVAGVRTVLGSTTTNPLPVAFNFDGITSTPQIATVVRSVNAIAKAHTAGTTARLAQPLTLAL
ncbi:hypothetical protein ACFUO0_17730 [Streptomyces cinereoruber]|uniref:hypothetical protein n=1 Tax=Streptomyces cinereoruber TaxID=67260 RepID=UPI00363286E0